MTAARAALWRQLSWAMVGGVQIQAFASPARIPSLHLPGALKFDPPGSTH